MADLVATDPTNVAGEQRRKRGLAYADAYTGEAHFNAADAAKLVGYEGSRSKLRVIGCKILKRPEVKARVAKNLEQAGLGKQEILARYARMADAEVPTEVVKGRGGKTERFEAMQALDRIAKIQGLLGGDTTQVNVNLTVSLPREERVDRILDILFPPAPAIEEGEAMEADYTEEGGDDNVAGDW